MEFGAGPGDFVHAVDAVDDDVRAEPADVTAERADSTVGGHEEGEDVEAFRAVVAGEGGAGPGGGADAFEDLG